MERVKLPISRILNNTNRQVTYSKRRNGLLKKAYENAVLCDIDTALLMISPSGRISCFSGNKRIEDVFLKYFNLSDEERESDHELVSVVNDKESVMNTLIRLKTEEAATQRPENLSKQADEYRQEILKIQQQLELAKKQLNVLEPEQHRFSSLRKVESCEEFLLKTLNLVEDKKRQLLSDRSSSYQDTVEAEATAAALENTELGCWIQHENENNEGGSKNNNVCTNISDAYLNLERNETPPPAVLDSMHETPHDNQDHQPYNEGFQMNNTNDEYNIQQWNQSSAYFLPSYSKTFWSI